MTKSIDEGLDFNSIKSYKGDNMGFTQISSGLISFLVFLVPVFFTTLTPEYYATNKEMLLLVFIPLLFFLWALISVKNKKITFGLNNLNLPVVLFGLAFVISTIVASVDKIDSLTVSTGTGVIIALVLLYLIIANIVTKKEQITYPLIASGTLLGLLFALQFFGLTQKLFPYDFIKDNVWTPAGTLIGLAIVLTATLPLAVEEGLTQAKNVRRFLFGWITTVVLSLGLLLAIIALFKDGKPMLLPYDAAWAIAVDSLRNLKNAVFGIGPGQFVNAFTQSKPFSLNSGNLWAVRFGASSSYLLQILTEVGLIGFVSYLLIAARLLRAGRQNLSQATYVSLLILFAAQIFLPSTILVLFMTFVLLALFSKHIQTKELSEQGIILSRLFITLAVVVLATSYWFGIRWYRAEAFFMKSLVAASQNKGLDTYNAQIKAIQLNPYSGQYRVSYSQTNLALASAITKKGNLSDQERKDVSTLIQQAIREAKLATSLNPNKASNWENLALIYRNLINATDGADQWAIASYNQAIKSDPLNPSLRLNLGGVFYTLKNYDAAIQQFTLAVNLKPNWANAHYNLSAAYKEKGNFQEAFREMQNTLALVDQNSNDFNKASAELEELRKKLPVAPETKKEQAAETLTEPQQQTVEVKPKLELPKEEVAPEIPKEKPSPTQEASPNK